MEPYAAELDRRPNRRLHASTSLALACSGYSFQTG
jgi:hypothetical protein